MLKGGVREVRPVDLVKTPLARLGLFVVAPSPSVKLSPLSPSQVLDALRGPWMPYAPSDGAVRRFVGVAASSPTHPHAASAATAAALALARGGGGERAALEATIEQLSVQLAKAVRQREWDIAVSIQLSRRLAFLSTRSRP
jgi:hypothetical protein